MGGLHVLGTERHESRRIDNQLRGRSGRQGDPGSSQFYLSLGDDLLRLFGSDRIGWVMERFNFPEDLPIQHPIISRSIENAQRQVESRNFEIRKNVLEYDDVMNKQREVIYKRRAKILEEDSVKEYALELIQGSINSIVDLYINPNEYPENWNISELSNFLTPVFVKDLMKAPAISEKIASDRLRSSELKELLNREALNLYEERQKELTPEILRQLEKLVMLNIIDNRWREQLLEMDYLKEGIGLRAIGQRDPLVEYKHESYNLFKELIEEIKVDTVKLLFNAKIVTREEQEQQEEKAKSAFRNVKTSRPQEVSSNDSSTASRPSPVKVEKIGRNDPCPCGSGKKYKKCCGK
jgi:preprotein translocase subunit SecA